MMKFCAAIGLAAVLAAGAAQAADAPPPDTAAMIQANSYPLSYKDGRLSGPGAEVLRKAAADAQFVLLGENHYDHEIPIFAGVLYRMLHDEQGFHHLALEQDRVAMEEATKPGARGDAARIGAVAGRYPTLFEFASDQDLELLALVGRTESGPQPLWGLEQTTSAARYLEELRDIAPTARLRAHAHAVLDHAEKIESAKQYQPTYLIDATATPELEALQSDFAAKPGSRADFLLKGLIKSAEIYGYYRRSDAGEYVGLYNNTVREQWMKDTFMADYRRAATGGKTPKVMFKFGDWHMFRGMGPTGAYTTGNFAHEFAISNGMQAVGIELIALRKDFDYAKDIPEYIRVLLPSTPPTQPLLIDLRPLRPVGKLIRDKVAKDDQWLNRAFVNGYEFVLILPDSRRADMTLSGLKFPGI
jgi:hypothetical protein